ncbi:MAG: carbohydrate ABC transporter permease [Firmicutes bacterium]|nr:carbohydrate ABC transporter permease [Bacillota bacterium]
MVPAQSSIRNWTRTACTTGLHVMLLAYSIVVLYPFFLMIVTSFKSTREIFFSPFGLPAQPGFETYLKVWKNASFNVYFANSAIITGVSVLLILAVGSLAAYGLARYNFRMNTAIYLFFLAGLMLPIRLGIVPLFLLMKNLNLVDTRSALILTYVANGMPFAIFVLTGFFRTLPGELEEAARLDGCGEFMIFHRVMLPLIRPALATVTIFNFVPLWNDLFFPLIFIRSDALKTIPLGMTLFFGQYETEWGLLFAGLVIATIPLATLYLFMSRQFIKGLTAGAIK